MTLQAAFAATLVDEWVRAGVRHCVIAPGSRSAPLARALLADGRLEVDVRLDERSAAFFALGVAQSSGQPAVVVTTSGTASAELHAAVLEADLAGVPLICCTADRPPELHRIGAPQTLEQDPLFTGALRFAFSPGVPDEANRPAWRSIASRAVAEARSGPSGPGPVQLNLAFREPLVTEVGALPEGRPDGRPWHETAGGPGAPERAVERLAEVCAAAERGVVLAGRGAAGCCEGGREAVVALARDRGWPVLADPTAWPRLPGEAGEVIVAAGDHVLRSEAAWRRLEPDLVLRLGSPPASKVLSGWLAGLAPSARQALVDPFGRFQDPERSAGLVLRADPGLLARAVLEALPRGGADRSWASSWARAEAAAQQRLEEELGNEERLSEPGLARSLFAAAPEGSAIVVSSSMPVRDLEWFARPRRGAPRVLSNRGANGIDGVVSTVLGVARERSLAGRGQTIGLVGDLAFFHDLSGLVWGAGERPPDVRLVVADNGGGGIFSFLPYAPVTGAIEPAMFERAFGTPQRPDVAAVAEALGHRARSLDRRKDLEAALADQPEGIEVLVVPGERERNLAVHRRLERVVVEAVEGALRSG